MTARWPDPDRAIIDRYVAILDLHSMKSRACYRQVLHDSQDVAERYDALGQEVLIAWLRKSAECWAATTRLHRTRIIDRFLERLVEIGAIEHNPVTALRDVCNIKQCMPIWRALASRDPEQALAELRQPRPFASVLGEMMAEHVGMMRRRGYKYTSQPLLLLRFDRFLQLHPGPEAEPLSAMIDRWAATHVRLLTEKIDGLMLKLREATKANEDMRRLCTVPGVGPVTAGAILAFAPDLRAFKSGRNFAAWLGLVPRQHSTGGKTRLGGVSKMGQTDIRKLLIVGAMSMIRW
ncbi:transposase, partial [Agrobacterium vitis]